MIYVLRQWKGGNVTGVCSHLARHRVSFRVIEAWKSTPLPRLGREDALVVLGGPPSVCRFHDDDYEVYFLRREAAYLEEARRLGASVMGICLGHQLLGAMRANEVATGELVFGLEDVEITETGRGHWLYAGVPRHIRVYQHHRDAVRTVGLGQHVLASSATCAIESVAWDDRIVSMQFHPEALGHELPAIIEQYSSYLSARGTTLEAMMARLPADYETTTRRIFDNFLYRAGATGRPAWVARTWHLSQVAQALKARPAA